MSPMRNLVLLFLSASSLVMAGCGVMADHTEVLEPNIAHADGTRWAQYCTYRNPSDLQELNIWLDKLGSDGWELTSIGGRDATIYCFKTRIATAASTAPITITPAPPPPAEQKM